MTATAATAINPPEGTDWESVRSLLAPGAHLAVFTGPHYWDTTARIETAGFEVRDSIRWHNHHRHEHILLARAPMAGTVTSNVATHGTGCINIDGTRVRVHGEVIHVPQSDPSKRAGLVGKDLGITSTGIDRFQQAQRESIERTLTLGRFPSNLLLSHHPDCQRTGTRKIKAITGTVAGRGIGKPSNVYGHYNGDLTRAGDPTGYGDDNGEETIDAWVCHHRCPIHRLDTQVGTLKSGVPGIMRAGVNNGACYGTESRPPGTQMTGYGDEGGPSRFFPCFPAGLWFAYQWVLTLITPPQGTHLHVGDPAPTPEPWPPVVALTPEPGGIDSPTPTLWDALDTIPDT